MIVVARRTSEFGEIEIRRSRKDGSHAYVRGSWYHSHADRLGRQPRELRPCGSTGFPSGRRRAGPRARLRRRHARHDARTRRQAGHDGRCRSDAFDLARAFFSLAPEIECHVADARAFLERARQSFDTIVVDSFFRNALPVHLCSSELLRLARSRLEPNGTILFNAVVAHDLDRIADRLAAGLAEAGCPRASSRPLASATATRSSLAGRSAGCDGRRCWFRQTRWRTPLPRNSTRWHSASGDTRSRYSIGNGPVPSHP